MVGQPALGAMSPWRGATYRNNRSPSEIIPETLDLPPDATRAQLLDAMKDVIVGKAAYVGRFRQWRLTLWDAVRGESATFAI